MPNKYLADKKKREQAIFSAGEQIGMQKMLDYVYIALNENEGFGHDRCQRLYDRLKELVDIFHPAFTEDVEADYVQEQLDRKLSDICGDGFYPFYERYPDLKRFTYNKSRKGWV